MLLQKKALKNFGLQLRKYLPNGKKTPPRATLLFYDGGSKRLRTCHKNNNLRKASKTINKKGQSTAFAGNQQSFLDLFCIAIVDFFRDYFYNHYLLIKKQRII